MCGVSFNCGYELNGRGGSPRRRGLAWARVSRLSKSFSPERDSSAWARSWARAMWCLVVSLILDDWHLLRCNCYVKNMRRMVMYEWCDSLIVNEGFGMDLACNLNEKGWIKETWYWYEILKMSWYDSMFGNEWEWVEDGWH